MSSLLTIAGKDLRQRLRDRSLVLLGVVAPFGLALIFSFLLGPATSGDFRPAIGLVDLDASPTSAEFGRLLGGLHEEGTIELVTGLDEETARARVDEGDLSAAYLVPAGFHDRLTSGEAARIGIVGNVDAPTSTTVAEAIARSFTQHLRAAQLAVLTTATLTATPPDPALAEEAAGREPPISIGTTEAASRQLDPETYYTAAMAVFFVFFTVSVGVTSLLDERRDGTMARLLAAPIPRRSIVGGKALTSIVLGVVSMSVLAVASTLLLGADWGDPLGAAALVLAVVLAAVGIMALVAGFANTPESAGNIQSIIAVTLGALGGSFFQVSLAEGFLARAAMLTPHHWFLDGLAQLAGGGGVADVLPAVAAILAFALVTGTIGSVFLSRKVSL